MNALRHALYCLVMAIILSGLHLIFSTVEVAGWVYTVGLALVVGLWLSDKNLWGSSLSFSGSKAKTNTKPKGKGNDDDVSNVVIDAEDDDQYR